MFVDQYRSSSARPLCGSSSARPLCGSSPRQTKAVDIDRCTLTCPVCRQVCCRDCVVLGPAMVVCSMRLHVHTPPLLSGRVFTGRHLSGPCRRPPLTTVFVINLCPSVGVVSVTRVFPLPQRRNMLVVTCSVLTYAIMKLYTQSCVWVIGCSHTSRVADQ